MRTIVDAVTQCKFEATYPASDECVLFRILEVLVACVRSDLGRLLGGDQLINAVNACYRIGQLQTGRGRDTSDILNLASRHALAQLVHTVFSRLEALPAPAETEEATAVATHATASRLLLATVAKAPASVAAEDAQQSEAGVGTVEPATEPAHNSAIEAVTPSAKPYEIFSLLPSTNDLAAGSDTDFYDVAAVCEVLTFVVSMIAAGSDDQGTAQASHGLELMETALHAAGSSLAAHDSLMAVLQEELVRAMFAAASAPGLACLTGVCRVALSLYVFLGELMLLQVEALLGLLLLPMAEGKATPTVAHQQVALEVSFLPFSFSGVFWVLKDFFVLFSGDVQELCFLSYA
jgi:golgi-specific brefeldin A-resistance guanine nucleotide exchange factor 1